MKDALTGPSLRKVLSSKSAKWKMLLGMKGWLKNTKQQWRRVCKNPCKESSLLASFTLEKDWNFPNKLHSKSSFTIKCSMFEIILKGKRRQQFRDSVAILELFRAKKILTLKVSQFQMN
jgi:hypothetical protein